MKNHIGYLESTVLKAARCGCAVQKRRIPTKKPRIHTIFVISGFSPWPSLPHALCTAGPNLPELFRPEARL